VVKLSFSRSYMILFSKVKRAGNNPDCCRFLSSVIFVVSHSQSPMFESIRIIFISILFQRCNVVNNSKVSVDLAQQIWQRTHDTDSLLVIRSTLRQHSGLLGRAEFQKLYAETDPGFANRRTGLFSRRGGAIFGQQQRPKNKLLISPDQIACHQRAETVCIVDNGLLFKIVLPDSSPPNNY